MKKLVIVTSFLLLIAAGCNKGANNNSTSNNNRNTASLIYQNTNNWLTYTNNQLGFQFKYPPDWHVITPTVEQSTGLIVSLKSLQTQQMDSNQNDLDVSEWDSINNSYAKGGIYAKPVYKNLADFMNDPDALFIKKTSDITVAGQPAYKVIIGGAGANDGIMFEHHGVYQLSFPTINDGKYLSQTNSNVEDLIASTWTFTK